jgi:hypothetical protein
MTHGAWQMMKIVCEEMLRAWSKVNEYWQPFEKSPGEGNGPTPA